MINFLDFVEQNVSYLKYICVSGVQKKVCEFRLEVDKGQFSWVGGGGGSNYSLIDIPC